LANVTLRGVTKSFGGVTAVDELSLEIHDQEFLVLLGPSGCGKTTALRMIAGLETPTTGDIMIGDRRVNDVSPRDRDVAMVFQNYALYPHMSVFDNMAFALKMRKTPRSDIDRRVRNAADLLQIEHLLQRKPRQLSGGERQRVALARAIVREPQVFLMDEPLSNLDAQLRVHTRAELVKLQHRLQTTTIYVTHDQTEAMTMADRVVVMRGGVLQQVDEPQQLYDRPASRFVGSFIGSPGMNFFEGRLVSDSSSPVVDAGVFQFPWPPYPADALAPQSGQAVTIGIRPEDLIPAAEASGNGVRFQASVDLIEPLGSDKLVHCVAEGTEFIARVDPRLSISLADQVTWFAPLDRLHLFDATTGLRLC
jgi:multiple sugar transport system ATP-binding protein